MDEESPTDTRQYQQPELLPELRVHRSPHFLQGKAEIVVIFKIVQRASYGVKLREALNDRDFLRWVRAVNGVERVSGLNL